MEIDFSNEKPGFKSSSKKRGSVESWMFGKNVIELQALPGRTEGSVNYRIVLSALACEQLSVTDETNILTLWDKKEEGVFIGNVSSLTLAKADQLILSKVQNAADIKHARVSRNKIVLSGLGEGSGVGFYTIEDNLPNQSLEVAKLVYLGKDASSTDTLESAPNEFVPENTSPEPDTQPETETETTVDPSANLEISPQDEGTAETSPEPEMADAENTDGLSW